MYMNYKVKYQETKKDYKKKVGISQKLRSRCSSGCLCKRLSYHWCYFKKYPSWKALERLLHAFSAYCIGDTLSHVLFKVKEEDKIGGVFIPEKNKILYHWTSRERLDLIREKGLVPSEDLNFVYVTDDAEYLAKSGYFNWRVMKSKKDIKFVLIKIDAERLAQEYKIFYVFAEHEYAVKRVPLEFLEIEDGENAAI